MLKHKLAAAFAVVALASPAVAWAEDEPLPVQIVDAMNKAFGPIPDSAPIMQKAWWLKAASRLRPRRRR